MTDILENADLMIALIILFVIIAVSILATETAINKYAENCTFVDSDNGTNECARKVIINESCYIIGNTICNNEKWPA